jgi:hypothetical protein
MRKDVRLIAAAIIVAGIFVAAAVAVTGRYAIGKHYLDSDVQYVYGINSWTGEPFVKAARLRGVRYYRQSAAIG